MSLLKEFTPSLSLKMQQELEKCFWIVETRDDNSKEYLNVLPMRQSLSIAYQDKNEIIDKFVENLFNAIYFFVNGNKTPSMTEMMTVMSKSQNTFRARHSNISDTKLIQGQLGELLLWFFIEYFYKAVPLVRKQQVIEYGNETNERKGSDAIHVCYDKHSDKYQFFFGESKLYKDFNTGFNTGIKSITEHYSKLFTELAHYSYAMQFEDEELANLANLILNNKFTDIQYEKHFVLLLSVTGHNIQNRNSDEEIKKEILSRLHKHYDKICNPKSNQTFHNTWKDILDTNKIPNDGDYCEPNKFHFVFLVVEQWGKFLKKFYYLLNNKELELTLEEDVDQSI
ncbi:MAG: HamA C-terminal domain-containing protein [Brevinema sp.]